MNTLIHADIFFFITTIVVAIVGLLLLIAGFYVVRILSDFKNLSSRVKREGELFSDDLSDLRAKARRDGLRLAHFIEFFTKRGKSPRGKK